MCGFTVLPRIQPRRRSGRPLNASSLGRLQPLSLDAYYHDALKREKHPARWLWRTGDLLYYLGIFSVLGGLLLGIVAEDLFGWLGRAVGLWLLFGGIVASLLGCVLKSLSHSWGERSGVSEAVEYDRAGDPPAA